VKKGKIIFVFIFSILLKNILFGQSNISDTLRIKLNNAESIFLNNNYQLLAQKYNIESQKALIIQAKLLPNPNFSYGRGPVFPLNDPNSNYPKSSFFSNSESSASISQLITTAGKRNKQIKIAEKTASLSEFQFYDLVRTLKFTLRSDFFNLFYLQQSASVYDKEIANLEVIVNAFNEQEGKGYISQKEVVRIKAQLYTLKSEYNDLENQINDIESELRLLLQLKQQYILPVISEDNIIDITPSKYSYSILLDSAYVNRPDLAISKLNTNLSNLNYSYQKSLTVPDITASASYDKQGSYAQNFHSIGISFDLPFLNRNQGNIKSAQAIKKTNEINEKLQVLTIEEQVSRALQKAIDNDKLYKSIDKAFSLKFDSLLNEVFLNYKKRNISLIDFLDFYEAYKQNVIQVNTIKYNRVNAFEEINFYTGTSLFN
jgi:cobalt-zinc-cadmium efflux system outer membrane protein